MKILTLSERGNYKNKQESCTRGKSGELAGQLKSLIAVCIHATQEPLRWNYECEVKWTGTKGLEGIPKNLERIIINGHAKEIPQLGQNSRYGLPPASKLTQSLTQGSGRPGVQYVV